MVSLEQLSLYARVSSVLVRLSQTSSLTSLLMTRELNADHPSTVRQGQDPHCLLLTSSSKQEGTSSNNAPYCTFSSVEREIQAQLFWKRKQPVDSVGEPHRY